MGPQTGNATLRPSAADLLLMLALAIAIALFVAMGGDGEDNAEHGRWMARTEEAGACVMW